MDKKVLYTFITAVLAIGTYLHSPLTVLGAVALWGMTVAESVLNQKKRDAEISALILRMEKLEKTHSLLQQDITNVAERAKTILGEVY